MRKLLTLFIAMFALGACGTSQSAPATSEATQPTSVTIGLTYIPDIQFAPLYVAAEEGYFTDAGVDVKLRHHGAQESLFGALQSGEEDIVFAGGDEMMQARSTGVDVVNWATMYQTYPVSLIVRKDSPITSARDLEGKKIGLPGPYGENYYALLAMLDSYSLADKVDVHYIGYTQAAALTKGEVDAIVGFSNNDSVSIAASGVEVREIPMVDGDLPLIGVGLGSLSTELDTATYAKVLTAIEKGVADCQKDPQHTLDIAAKYVPSLADPAQRAIAEKVLGKTIALYAGSDVFGQQDDEQWKHMSQFLEKVGVLEKSVPADEAFTNNVIVVETK